MKKIILLTLLFCNLQVFSQVEKVEPPHWWTGFEQDTLQLLVYGKEIGSFEPEIDYPGIKILQVNQADSPNYLFIDLLISDNAEAGRFEVKLSAKGKKKRKFEYELKKRTRPESHFKGFDNSDAIYLITPDRFANGDESNDEISTLNEKKIDRENDYGRHGGDIRGIISNLDYIEEMGFTALWSSPLLINDMPESSYHGYAITDFYRVDPRFGTMEEYLELAKEARERDIKLIMDMVANHSGSKHWWMKDLPFNNWINYQERFENGQELINSNHRRTANQDEYASMYDKERLNAGWFVESMPDLNQRNPYMAKYIIQNSIWWIEQLGLGGIRQDTYPYPDKEFMSDWAGAIMQEYPEFNIVGEEWSNNPLLIRYWQQGVQNKDGYVSNLKSTMDFAMQNKIVEALNEEETWGTGFVKMYEGLANDFAYASPENILIFPDNHDMSRIYTQLKEDIPNTEMALAYILTLPRMVQIYYGTEILMNDSAKPGDHGVIRTEFPGGWKDSEKNAFTGEGLSEEEREMQLFLKTLLNYRKNSNAIQQGKTIHFAPENNIYVISRSFKDETVVLVLNKNEEITELTLERFKELNLDGQTLQNLISGEHLEWNGNLRLPERGAYFLTTKTN